MIGCASLARLEVTPVNLTFNQNLDLVLGSQVKQFLSTFNRVAVQRMISFILSQENRQSLSKANKNLVQSILTRPLNSLIPASSVTDRIRSELWAAVRDIPIDESKKNVDFLYDFIGTKTLQEFVNIDEFVSIAPSSR